MTRRRSGFTLIEILVVIGIILVLIGMLVVGYNQLDRSTAGRSTRTTLENMGALSDELESEVGPGYLEGTNVPPALFMTGISVTQPGDVNPGQAPHDAEAKKFANVIKQLMRSSKNKASIAGIPTKQLFGKDSAGVVVNPPGILDAWSNPIIFVPSGGLTGVSLAQGPNGNGTMYTIRSSGVYPEPLSNQNKVLGPKDRPFFASAGQDGDFSKGDDNVYSFEN